jgi:hypothetical protein
MRNIPGITTLVGLMVCGSTGVAAAQSSDEKVGSEVSAAGGSEQTDDTLPGAPDTAQKKKGGGLLGKVKGVAKNKVVQQVAKTAACTMLPGGQVVAGAIDAAANKDAVGAAAGAATGTTCMPGMGGAGAMADGAMTGGALPGGAMPGMVGMPAGVAGAGGQPSGMDPAMMAAYSAQMAAAMQAMQSQVAQSGAGGAGMPPGMPPGAMPMPPGGTEMSPNALEVSPDLDGDLKKGKTVIRNIDWIPGGGAVAPAGADGFARAMAQVAAAMKQAGGSYRLDIYMDKQSGDVVVRTLGPQRLAAVQASLVEGGAGSGADGPQVGKSKKDGDPRLEIVRLK